MQKPFKIKYNKKNFEKFLTWSLDYLEKKGKKVTFYNTKSVFLMDGGYRCRGWCDGKEMAAATKNENFPSVYTHEFSHMQQAIERVDVWENCSTKFWTQLENGKISLDSWSSVLDTIAIERDCERRTLLTSKHWGLFDNEAYAKCANLYLYFYQYVFITRRWVPTSKIQHPKIVAEMPTKLIPLSKFKTIDMKMMNLFDKYLGKK